MTGALVRSPPLLGTVIPLGGQLVHATTHVTAVAHSYDTDLILPSH